MWGERNTIFDAEILNLPYKSLKIIFLSIQRNTLGQTFFLHEILKIIVYPLILWHNRTNKNKTNKIKLSLN